MTTSPDAATTPPAVEDFAAVSGRGVVATGLIYPVRAMVAIMAGSVTAIFLSSL